MVLTQGLNILVQLASFPSSSPTCAHGMGEKMGILSRDGRRQPSLYMYDAQRGVASTTLIIS